MTRAPGRAVLAVAVALGAGCGDRSEAWDRSPELPAQAIGLSGAVAIVDRPTSRAVLVVPKPDHEVDVVPLAIGHNAAKFAASPDQSRLFVLATGDVPRRTSADETASLTVIDGSSAPSVVRRFALPIPLTGLAIDPEGRWAAVYSGGAGGSFVENPNEIVLVDLSAPAGPRNPVVRTLRSFGGRPKRLTFTPALSLPGGSRRLLVVETDRDLSILDLDHAQDAVPRDEITVRLTSGADTRIVAPAGLAVDDGDPSSSEDARIGVRLENDTNVVTLVLGKPTGTPPPPNDFGVRLNLTEVGGVPTDIAFVRTDGGLRLAAIVPSRGAAVLVEPDTSITADVKLPAPYQRIALVTAAVSATPGQGADVALLWGGAGSTGGVALWALGKTAGTPYHSVETVPLGASVTAVLDVAPPRGALKVLQAAGSGTFWVLDLASRTASPLIAPSGTSLSVAPDGGRVWAWRAGGRDVSSVDLDSLGPHGVTLDHGAASVHDVARLGGGRSVVVVDSQGGVGATVADAAQPDSATARRHGGLLLRGL